MALMTEQWELSVRSKGDMGRDRCLGKREMVEIKSVHQETKCTSKWEVM